MSLHKEKGEYKNHLYIRPLDLIKTLLIILFPTPYLKFMIMSASPITAPFYLLYNILHIPVGHTRSGWDT